MILYHRGFKLQREGMPSSQLGQTRKSLGNTAVHHDSIAGTSRHRHRHFAARLRINHGVRFKVQNISVPVLSQLCEQRVPRTVENEE